MRVTALRSLHQVHLNVLDVDRGVVFEPAIETVGLLHEIRADGAVRRDELHYLSEGTATSRFSGLRFLKRAKHLHAFAFRVFCQQLKLSRYRETLRLLLRRNTRVDDNETRVATRCERFLLAWHGSTSHRDESRTAKLDVA